ncbi:MAG: hypothetical protein HWD58_17605 [Bacteroidota bacterium]|nr:MAG: hypothetical protein HWD58_17605 [Bacteroidota bacterium]
MLGFRYALVFLPFGLFAPVVHAQPQRPGLKLDTTRVVQGDETRITVTSTDGKVVEEGILIGGRREGVWYIYHDNGFPKTVIPYRQGLKEGAELHLGKDGYLEEQISYSKDILHGPSRQYFKGSRLQKESFLYKALRKADVGYIIRIPDYKRKVILSKGYVTDQPSGTIQMEKGRRIQLCKGRNGRCRERIQ